MKKSGGQQAVDPRVADLVRAGKLRVALFLPQYTNDPVAGEIRGKYAGTVMVQMAHAIAASLGVEVQLVGYPNPPTVVESIKAGACDVALLGINASRAAEVGFTPPLVLYPFTYLVPASSSIRSVADADRSETRVAVLSHHESTLALERVRKHAELIETESPEAAFDLLRSGHVEAFAAALPMLMAYSAKLPGSRVLEDHYGGNLLAMAVSKDKAGRLAYFSEFVEETKASGLVQRAIDRAGEPGIRVAPAGNPSAQK
jgi:polar amino acid transport system substrate-binding protein